jgi:hypothetical protein
MARLAAGRNLGVAPNADLYLIKTKGQYTRKDGRVGTTTFNPLSMQHFLNAVTENIEGKLPEQPGDKIVINMSWGKTLSSFIFNFV